MVLRCFGQGSPGRRLDGFEKWKIHGVGVHGILILDNSLVRYVQARSANG